MYIFVCMYVFTYMYLYMYLYECLKISMFLMNIYIYVYIDIHICALFSVRSPVSSPLPLPFPLFLFLFLRPSPFCKPLFCPSSFPPPVTPSSIIVSQFPCLPFLQLLLISLSALAPPSTAWREASTTNATTPSSNISTTTVRVSSPSGTCPSCRRCVWIYLHIQIYAYRYVYICPSCRRNVYINEKRMYRFIIYIQMNVLTHQKFIGYTNHMQW